MDAPGPGLPDAGIDTRAADTARLDLPALDAALDAPAIDAPVIDAPAIVTDICTGLTAAQCHLAIINAPVDPTVSALDPGANPPVYYPTCTTGGATGTGVDAPLVLPEVGGGVCPSPVYAWSYAVPALGSIAWDTDGDLVAGSWFFPTTTTFGGKTMTNGGSADMLVAKLDPATGNANWVFTAGDSNDQATSYVATTSGNLAVVGTFTGALDIDPINGVIPPIVNTGTTAIDFIVGLKDSDGAGVWSKKVDLGGGHLNALAGNPSQNYFLVCGAAMNNAANLGATGTPGGGKDVIVAAIKANDGTVVWAKLFGGAMDQACNAAALDDSGNAYFAGTYAGNLDFGLGALTPAPTGVNDQIAWVAKLNGATGAAIAFRAFGTSGTVAPTVVALDSQSTLVVAGGLDTATVFGSRTLTPVGATDAFVVKLDPSTLTPLWARNMGGTGDNVSCQGAAVDSSGKIAAVGRFSQPLTVGPGSATVQPTVTPGHFETFVVTLDGTSGQTLCAHGYGDPASTGNAPFGIAINRGATGANKDRVAIVGDFTQIVDFSPTMILSAASGSSAYLFEM